MERKTLSKTELKKRKMLLVLPVLTLPFITLLFWSLGGGNGPEINQELKEKEGFNLELPLARFKEDEEGLDKMSYYQKAASDSVKLLEQLKKDPNYMDSFEFDDEDTPPEDLEKSFVGSSLAKSVSRPALVKDPNQEMMYQKLRALQKAIDQPSAGPEQDHDLREFKNYGSEDPKASQIKDLEQLMGAMSQPEGPDPELEQLGGMLENILDIQHPSRMEQKLKESTRKRKTKVFAVDKQSKTSDVSLLEAAASSKGFISKSNAFYDLQEDQTLGYQQNAIQAVVHQTQTLVNGSTVKLRLTAAIFIGTVQIPKNSFLYGTAALKGERLEVQIHNIMHANSLFPVELSLYDIDGIEGVYIPGALNRDVAKASADRSIQTLGMEGLDDSWGTQAAGMGIEAAKSLFSKKVKRVKVVVKAGYQVLLYDEKQKNDREQ